MTAPAMLLLLVEDDPQQARLFARVLAEGGYVVEHAATGEAGVTLAHTGRHAGILLDLGLPDRHGLAVLQALRRDGCTAPVLVLSGQAGEADVVRALDAGADDHVAKPVSPTHLLARVRALLRRGGARRDDVVAVGTLVLNERLHRVLHQGTPLDLTPREYALLAHLMRHADAVVSRATLLHEVWGLHHDPGSNVVDAVVVHLRRKLRPLAGAPRLAAVRGTGFVLSR